MAGWRLGIPILQNTHRKTEVQRFYGFVESITKAEMEVGSSYARTQYILDAIDANHFHSNSQLINSTEGLAVMRLQTTSRRFAEIAELASDGVEGSWAELELGVEVGKPIIWKLVADDSYSRAAERFNLISLRILRPDEAITLGLVRYCEVRSNTAEPPSRLQAVGRGFPLGVRVLDVGHASCVAIHRGSDFSAPIVGYYDVGYPVFFHAKGFPKSFRDKCRVPSDGFVVLSHWDFDHYALALTIMPSLLRLQWYAPAQPVGPNAARLQRLLGPRLHLSTRPRIQIGPHLVMWRGSGLLSDRNNSGYVLRITAAQRAVLLTGDVSYCFIPAGAMRGITGLAITHHGGNGANNPPSPRHKNRCIAAVSYGMGNRYKHPSTLCLSQHTSVGWLVKETATPFRSDVWL